MNIKQSKFLTYRTDWLTARFYRCRHQRIRRRRNQYCGWIVQLLILAVGRRIGDPIIVYARVQIRWRLRGGRGVRLGRR